MKLFSINAGYFKLDGGAMFGVVPKSIWNKLNPADENNMCTWALRCMLIDTGDRRILVDTGMGNKQDAKFFSYYFMHGNDTLDSTLAKVGYKSDDITDVFHTHLHFDHCGGSIDRVGDQLIPAFKNATFWCNERHWKWATEPNEREKASFLKDNILPLQASGKLKFVEVKENVSFAEGITIKFAYGHTDAMMLPCIQYKGRTVVFMADLLASAAHMPLPYVMGYDMFPLTTLHEKKALLNEALEHDYILFFEHDPKIECCTLQMTERGIRVKETFKLEEI